MTGEKHLSFNKHYAVLILIVLANIICQVFFMHLRYDISELNGIGSGDAPDYVRRAVILLESRSFSQAFGDAFRMPGYPVFLAVGHIVSGKPLLFARYAQIMAGAVMLIISIIILQSLIPERHYVYLGACIIALWPTLYYFAPFIIAESICLPLAALYFLLLVTIKDLRGIMPAVAVTGILILFRPNFVLFMIPLWAVMYRWERGRRFIIYFLLSLVVLGIIIGPWSLYASLYNRSFILLTTTTGMNLFYGTGATDRNEYSGNGLRLVRERLGLDDRYLIEYGNRVEMNRCYRKTALDRWRQRPISIMLYGFAKTAHAFGGSFRGVADIFQFIFFIVSLSAGIYLWRVNRQRDMVLAVFSLFFITVLQAFIFLPNQRFRVLFLDLPSLILVILALYEIVRSRD